MNLDKELELENYRRQLRGQPPLEKKKKGLFGIKSKADKIAMLKELHGKEYWCEKCKNYHFHDDEKYRKHVEYSKD